jgi:ADP-ribosyl-[dinitrogen reductase] hydrolase
MNLQERYRGALLGLAAGDAVGTTVEFRPRGSFPPVADMVGGGPFGLKPGQWTDDTSMALCLASSLVERQGFDAADQMDRYLRWYRAGYWSSTGSCFDIGNTTASALHAYERTRNPFSGSTDPHTAGNGSIMRLAPVAMYYYPDVTAAIANAAASSATTHAAAEAVDACRLLAVLLCRAFDGQDKAALLAPPEDGPFAAHALTPKIAAIAAGDHRAKPIHQIRGSGYVVESLEAALWCFATTDGYEAAILAAVNLGDDADTTAAVCGQIAGAHYGAAAIPSNWRAKLTARTEIEALADRLLATSR